MKYKDFKTLSQSEMKGIKGGNMPSAGCDNECKSACTVSGGHDGKCHQPTSGANAGKCFCVAAY